MKSDHARLKELERTEVVSLRLADTPDWVWAPLETSTAYQEYYVELLYAAPAGLRRAVGMYRKGWAFGKEFYGWWAPEEISEYGRPGHGWYIDPWIKGWRPYRYHLECEQLKQALDIRTGVGLGTNQLTPKGEGSD